MDNNGKLKYSVNIPLLKILNTEKYNILKYEKSIEYTPVNSQTTLHKILVNFNYMVGVILGNLKYALDQYIELTTNIVKYCQTNEIIPIVLGIGNRNNSSLEPIFCNNLNKFIKQKVEDQNISYIETINIKSNNKNKYFRKNGIHASEQYHQLISEKLFVVLKEKFLERD